MNLIKIGIDGLVAILGQGRLFDRITHQVQRINNEYPDTPGSDKKEILIRDLEVILGESAKSIVNLLIELAVTYIKSITPDIVDPVIDQASEFVEQKIDDAIDDIANIQS